ncbi:MAG: peptidyl-prolyl cis-trans isomerase [Verrucomicrobia bacterium]|nr:peptidyl-prolyl cis-trans isomerase [Verrucomicrobiota bacterium]
MNMITTKEHHLRHGGVQDGDKPRASGGAGLTGGARAMGMAAVWVLLTLAGGVVSAEPGAEAAKAKRSGDRVVAKVNGMPIHASDLEAMMSAQVRMLSYRYANDPVRLKKEMADVKRAALDGLIDCQLLEDEFFRLGGFIEKEDIENDVRQVVQESFQGDRSALMAEISAMGMTFDKYREMRERMIIMSAVRARIANSVQVTDEMVREHYEKNLHNWRGRESMKFHTLTVRNMGADDRKLAEGLRKRLVKGEDFEEMARENSIDSRADGGGAWPWTRLSDINDSVSEVLAKMKKGQVSPVLDQPGTLVILRVDDIRETEPKPLESVKEDVRKSLLEELGREKVLNRLSHLREAADIQKMGPVYGAVE